MTNEEYRTKEEEGCKKGERGGRKGPEQKNTMRTELCIRSNYVQYRGWRTHQGEEELARRNQRKVAMSNNHLSSLSSSDWEWEHYWWAQITKNLVLHVFMRSHCVFIFSIYWHSTVVMIFIHRSFENKDLVFWKVVIADFKVLVNVLCP